MMLHESKLSEAKVGLYPAHRVGLQRAKFEYIKEGKNKGYLVSEKETNTIKDLISNECSMKEIFERITGYSANNIEAIIFVVAYCDAPFREVTI